MLNVHFIIAAFSSRRFSINFILTLFTRQTTVVDSSRQSMIKYDEYYDNRTYQL